MEEQISVEDYLVTRRGKQEKTIRVEVASEWCGYKRVIRLVDTGFFPSPKIPIKDWPKFKDLVDRMILRFEQLEKA